MIRLTLLLFLTAIVLSCSRNTPPVIEYFVADPDSVFPGDTVTITFRVSDADDDGIHYMLSKSSGTWGTGFGSIEPSTWIAPKEPGDYYLTLMTGDLSDQVADSVLIHVFDTTGFFTDARDGHIYKWVKIGTQIWMAENLAWLPEVYPGKVGSMDTALYYVYDYEGYDVDLAKQTENYNKYGVLYNWQAASGGEENSSTVPSGLKGACPDGWHLPSLDEFSMLLIPHTQVQTDMLSASGWFGENNGSNKRGFNVFPGGYRSEWGDYYAFSGQYYAALFWTTTDHYLYWRPEAYVSVVRFMSVSVTGGHDPWSRWDEGLSVRCVKDE